MGRVRSFRYFLGPEILDSAWAHQSGRDLNNLIESDPAASELLRLDAQTNDVQLAISKQLMLAAVDPVAGRSSSFMQTQL